MDDVETLNRRAFSGDIDVTKLSYHAFAHCADQFALLDAGSALGRGCGPLLISKREISRHEVAAGGLRIAIPGVYTTANFLLQVWRFRRRAIARRWCSRKSKPPCSTGGSMPG